MHKKLVGIIDCSYRKGKLEYRLYEEGTHKRIFTDNAVLFTELLSNFTCLGYKCLDAEGETMMVSDSCIVFSSEDLYIGKEHT